MGWSQCNGYQKSIGAKVGKMIREFNKDSEIKITAKPMKLSDLGHEYRFNADFKGSENYREGYCCDCDKITHIKIPLNIWIHGSERVLESEFRCACTKAKKAEIEEYKGFTMFIRSTRRRLGKHFKITVMKDTESQEWAGFEAYDVEVLKQVIKDHIDSGTLLSVWGKVMV